jgi:hypothetical protein
MMDEPNGHRLHDCYDELLTVYFQHHPSEHLHTLSAKRLWDWSFVYQNGGTAPRDRSDDSGDSSGNESSPA